MKAMQRSSSITLFTLLLYMSVIHAESKISVNKQLDKVDGNPKLEQKIKMADYLIKQIKLSDRYRQSKDEIVPEIFQRAEDNIIQTKSFFEQQKWLEAEAVIEFVLRDISAASQLLKSSEVTAEKYLYSLRKLESFKLPEWSDLNQSERLLLDQEIDRIKLLKIRALEKANTGKYAESADLLDQAYRIKAGLIVSLQLQTTVIYDQNFNQAIDEYRFMLGRNHHYIELIELVRSQKQISKQADKLIESYVYQSALDIELAANMEMEGDYSAAIPVLDKSIKRLVSVLKILGVKI